MILHPSGPYKRRVRASSMPLVRLYRRATRVYGASVHLLCPVNRDDKRHYFHGVVLAVFPARRSQPGLSVTGLHDWFWYCADLSGRGCHFHPFLFSAISVSETSTNSSGVMK